MAQLWEEIGYAATNLLQAKCLPTKKHSKKHPKNYQTLSGKGDPSWIFKHSLSTWARLNSESAEKLKLWEPGRRILWISHWSISTAGLSLFDARTKHDSKKRKIIENIWQYLKIIENIIKYIDSQFFKPLKAAAHLAKRQSPIALMVGNSIARTTVTATSNLAAKHPHKYDTSDHFSQCWLNSGTKNV